MNFTGDLVLSWWRRFSAFPCGKWAFAKAIGWAVPYTSTISPRIVELEEGFSRTSMADRWGVRNHLSSVHALALANLGEFTASLAIISRIPSDRRWIVTGLNVEYLKKARGALEGTCDFRETELPLDGECEAVAEIRDGAGEVVTQVTARLKISPKKAAI